MVVAWWLRGGCRVVAGWLHAVARARISEERRRIDLHFCCTWLHGACSRTKPNSAPPDARLRVPYYAASPVLAGDILIFFIPPVLQSAETPYYEETQAQHGFLRKPKVA